MSLARSKSGNPAIQWHVVEGNWPATQAFPRASVDIFTERGLRVINSRLVVDQVIRNEVIVRLKHALEKDTRFALAFLLEEEELSWELAVLASVRFKYSLLRELTGITFEIQRQLPHGVISVLLFGQDEFDKQGFELRFGEGVSVK